MGRLAKLRALGGAERRLLVVAAVWIPLIAAGLAVAGYTKTQAVMARLSRPRGPCRLSEDAAAARAGEVGRVVAIAAGSGPVGTTCLRRSLLLWALLRREGIETILRVGVNRDGGTFHAHAWVEHRGRPLIDADDVAARFPAFEQDFGAAPAERS